MQDGYRERCLAAKGKQCEVCGDTHNVVVHHIDGNRENNDLSNLVPVCDSCHKSIHWGSDGYEQWHERLKPSAQWGDVDPDGRTSITLNQQLGERLRDMKPPAASWDTFFLNLLEELQTDQTIRLSEQDVDAITNRLATSGVAIEKNERDAIAETTSERVVDRLQTLQR